MDEKSTIRKVLFHDLIFLCYSSPQVPVISLAVYLAMILSRETTLGLIVWMPGQKMKQRKS